MQRLPSHLVIVSGARTEGRFSLRSYQYGVACFRIMVELLGAMHFALSRASRLRLPLLLC